MAALKEHRTPQAFRAFARIYIIAMSALYGPYVRPPSPPRRCTHLQSHQQLPKAVGWLLSGGIVCMSACVCCAPSQYVYLGKGDDGKQSNLGVALAFACGTQLAVPQPP